MKEKLGEILLVIGIVLFMFTMWAIYLKATKSSINYATKEQLLQVYYVGDETANDIIKNKPYSSLEDLKIRCNTVGNKKIKYLRLANYDI